MFLQGSGTVNFAPGAGVVQTLSNGIADQTGSGGTGANAGSWTLAKSGPGTLVLQAASTYSGGTAVSGGLVNFTAANDFGSGLITLSGGGLQWATGNTADISGQLNSIGSGRRHLRHQRQQRHLRHGAGRHGQDHQGRYGHAHLVGRQLLFRRHDREHRHAAVGRAPRCRSRRARHQRRHLRHQRQRRGWRSVGQRRRDQPGVGRPHRQQLQRTTLGGDDHGRRRPQPRRAAAR